MGRIFWCGKLKIMKEPKDLINWVELSRLLANNETSVSRNRTPKKYQDKVNSLIQSIDQWKKLEL